MRHARRSLPEPPPAQWKGRALLKFSVVHMLFLVACFAVGETVFRFLGHPAVYEIGPGKDYATLKSAESAISVDIANTWAAVGVFSVLVVLMVWLWKRAFRWFWIPLAFVPYLGPLFFAIPATWVLANRSTRPREPSNRNEPPNHAPGVPLKHRT